MCNPRRVRVTATREVCEAWQRVVRRTVELSDSVTGEARIRQALDASVGAPALAALDSLLASGQPGWHAVEDGYRCDVEGGYLIYRNEERELEIVATLQDRVQVKGEAQTQIEGVLQTKLEAEGEGLYFDDNYGGRGEDDARRDAEAAAQGRLDEVRKRGVSSAQDQAEAAASGSVELEAKQAAQRQLEQQAAARRAELERQAADHLESVGLRCRQEFHRVLAAAYRDAILAYARAHNAQNVHCSEDNDTVEIEFFVQR